MPLAMSSLVAGSLALTVLALVTGPAAASGSPADKYAVLNATVNAATDHEIAGSSAFPNYNSGAVDNYYSMAHSYLDSSPSAEGTASPADTGPIGQTAAAGNFAQPQYADARWPGNSGKATFGNQGGPYAVASASSYRATASASEASNGSSASSKSGKSGQAARSAKTRRIAGPKGFSRRLRRALRAWKAHWLPRLHLKVAGVRIPAAVSKSGTSTSTPTLTTPTLTTPTLTAPTLTTSTVTTPTLTTPTVTVPKVTTPTLTTPTKTSGSGSRTGSRAGSGSSAGNGGGVLESSTLATLDPGSGALVTSGESSLGHVSIGGQIVLEGIHVSAMITNSGTPTDKVSVDVGAATVGGVPVTIDQTGVHVNGQGQGLPFKQADDALNGALKQAGVQLFTVTPEVQKLPNEEQLTATGVHVKFAQPVDASGVPAQYVEHILGEVFIDSLAVPGVPFGNFNLGLSGGTGSGSGSSSSSSSGVTGPASGSGTATPGGSSTGATGFPSSVGSSSSSSSPMQTTSSSTSGSPQTIPGRLLAFAASKPVWLLIGYLVWQVLLLGTGASLRYWRAGGAL